MWIASCSSSADDDDPSAGTAPKTKPRRSPMTAGKRQPNERREQTLNIAVRDRGIEAV